MAQIEELVFSDNNEQEERVAGEESENNKSGGVISNLISALSPVAKAEDHVSSTSEEKSGGVFSNLISGILLHQSEDENDQEKKENNGDQGNHEQMDKEEAGGIVGGLVDNLVAHLPNSPLADDAAPATEEASILIHSIVHD